MTAVIDVDQARGDGLGASEAAEAIGVCPPSWGAPIKLWLEKTKRAERPPAGEAAKWGTILEPVVRGVYVESHRALVEIPLASLYHRAKPWLRATPDGINLRGGGLVQVKCPGMRTAHHWGTEDRREVPTYYLVQATVEMAVTDRPWLTFAVLLAGQDYFEITVRRDAELEADVLDACAAFWRCVERDVPPPIDGSPHYGRWLATLLAAKSKKIVEANPDLDAQIGRWKEIRAQIASLEDEQNTIKNRIMSLAVEEEARRIASSHGTVPIVESASVRIDWEGMARAFAKELGQDVDALVDDYTTRSPYAYVRAPLGWKEAA